MSSQILLVINQSPFSGITGWLLLLLSCYAMPDSLWPHGLWPSRLLCPWDFPGKNTGVGCHLLLHGSSRPRDKHWSSALADWFFTADPSWKLLIIAYCIWKPLWDCQHSWLWPCISTMFIPYLSRNCEIFLFQYHDPQLKKIISWKMDEAFRCLFCEISFQWKLYLFLK